MLPMQTNNTRMGRSFVRRGRMYVGWSSSAEFWSHEIGVLCGPESLDNRRPRPASLNCSQWPQDLGVSLGCLNRRDCESGAQMESRHFATQPIAPTGRSVPEQVTFARATVAKIQQAPVLPRARRDVDQACPGGAILTDPLIAVAGRTASNLPARFPLRRRRCELAQRSMKLRAGQVRWAVDRSIEYRAYRCCL
jgi:hypothetical protein